MKTEYPKYGQRLVMIDSDGGEYSANPSDYFMARPDHVFVDANNEPCVLAVIAPKQLIDPSIS